MQFAVGYEGVDSVVERVSIPFYKRPLVWLVVVIVVIGIAFGVTVGIEKKRDSEVVAPRMLMTSGYACYAPPMTYGSACRAYSGTVGQNGATITYRATATGSTSLQCFGIGSGYLGQKGGSFSYYNIFSGGTPICWGENAGYPSIYCKGVPLGSSFEWSYTIGYNSACKSVTQTEPRVEDPVLSNESDIGAPVVEFDNVTLSNISTGVIGRQLTSKLGGPICSYAAANIPQTLNECISGCGQWYPGWTPCWHRGCCVCNGNCDGGSCVQFNAFWYCPFR